MALTFPNPSRSYDAAHDCVCFWGYDNAREISFQVGREVLIHLEPTAAEGEAQLLAAFDKHRIRLLGLALEQFEGGKRNSYRI